MGYPNQEVRIAQILTGDGREQVQRATEPADRGGFQQGEPLDILESRKDRQPSED